VCFSAGLFICPGSAASLGNIVATRLPLWIVPFYFFSLLGTLLRRYTVDFRDGPSSAYIFFDFVFQALRQIFMNAIVYVKQFLFGLILVSYVSIITI